jgi:undecaprenyl-diphosphatase
MDSIVKSTTSKVFLIVLLLFMLACVALLVYRMSTTGYSAIDQSLSEAIRALRNPRTDIPMMTATLLGNWPTVAATVTAMCITLIYQKRWALVAGILAAMAAAGAFVSGIKVVIKAARPDSDLYTKGVSVFSFPSGHTTFSTLIGLLLIWFAWRGIRQPLLRALSIFIIFLMIMMVGVSRIYLGAHWPTDVAAGFLFSASLVILLSLIFVKHQFESELDLKVFQVSALTYVMFGTLFVIAVWPKALMMYAP